MTFVAVFIGPHNARGLFPKDHRRQRRRHAATKSLIDKPRVGALLEYAQEVAVRVGRDIVADQSHLVLAMEGLRSGAVLGERNSSGCEWASVMVIPLSGSIFEGPSAHRALPLAAGAVAQQWRNSRLIMPICSLYRDSISLW